MWIQVRHSPPTKEEPSAPAALQRLTIMFSFAGSSASSIPSEKPTAKLSRLEATDKKKHCVRRASASGSGWLLKTGCSAGLLPASCRRTAALMFCFLDSTGVQTINATASSSALQNLIRAPRFVIGRAVILPSLAMLPILVSSDHELLYDLYTV